MTPPEPEPESLGAAIRRRIRYAGKGVALVAILGAILLAIGYGDAVEATLMMLTDGAHGPLLVALLVGYAVMMAVPFLPGVEIGVAVLILFGAAAAPFVWVATVTGLLVSFAVGRLIPFAAVDRLLGWVGLGARASYLSADAHPDLSEEDRLCALFRGNAIASRLIGWRYVALAALLNLPGNMLVGGGGGIALLSGASRAFTPVWFVATVMLAVAPVPVAVMLFGAAFLA